MDYDYEIGFLHGKMEDVEEAAKQNRAAIIRLTNMVFGEVTLGYRKVDEKAIDPICAPDGTILLRAWDVTFSTAPDDGTTTIFHLNTGIAIDGFKQRMIYAAMVFPTIPFVGKGVVPQPPFIVMPGSSSPRKIVVECRMSAAMERYDLFKEFKNGMLAAQIIFIPIVAARLELVQEQPEDEDEKEI